MMEKQTIVVKVGTSSLTLSDGTMDAEKIRNITTQLAALQTAGHHVLSLIHISEPTRRS